MRRIKYNSLLVLGVFIVTVTGNAVGGARVVDYVSAAGTSGETYYLDSIDGSDGNEGTSEATPWKNLSKLHEINLEPGTTVYFKRGSSWVQDNCKTVFYGEVNHIEHAALVISNSGTSENPIVFTTYGNTSSPLPKFDLAAGSARSEGYPAIAVFGEWIVIDNLQVTSNISTPVLESAFKITKYAQNVTISDCEVSEVGNGFIIEASNSKILNNTVKDLKMVVNTSYPSWDDYGAVGYWIKNSDIELIGNKCINCLAESYDYGVDGGAIEVYADDGIIENIKIHRNLSDNTAGFIEFGAEDERTIQNIDVAYNVIIDPGLSTLHFNTSGLYEACISNVKFNNNTIYETRILSETGERPYKAFSTTTGRLDASQISVYNNIFFGYRTLHHKEEINFLHSHNLFYGMDDNGAFMTFYNERIITDDSEFKFINAEEGDLNIEAGSVVIDEGKSGLGYTKDYLGNIVYQGDSPDIGAYEYIDTLLIPVADFIANQTSVTQGTVINFSDISTNSPISWAWDFENDGTIDSTEQNPEHVYASSGVYTVSLTVSNIVGNDTEIKQSYVTVTGWSTWVRNGSTTTEVTMEEYNGKLYQAMRGTDGIIYTRYTSDGDSWSSWAGNGRSSGVITLATFDGKLYQSIRGNDGIIYTRNTVNGDTWTTWEGNGRTSGKITMLPFSGKLYQVIRGNDGVIYTRSTADGNMWNTWEGNGRTSGNITMIEYGGKLYQAIRGNEGWIWTRRTSDGSTWEHWVANGSTTREIEMVEYDGKLYQAIRGGEGWIWTRNSTDGSTWSTWVANGATSERVEMANYGTRLYQSVRGNDGGVWTRYTEDGNTWENWVKYGQTKESVTMKVFGGRLYQAVRDNSNYVSTAHLTE